MGGGKGGKNTPKDFEKMEKLKNMGYFQCIKVIKMNFSVWKGFYHDFSTKKASASGSFAPDPHQGALPPGPPPGALHPGPPTEVPLPPPPNDLPWGRPCLKI